MPMVGMLPVTIELSDCRPHALAERDHTALVRAVPAEPQPSHPALGKLKWQRVHDFIE